jgi:hypothetical protein
VKRRREKNILIKVHELTWSNKHAPASIVAAIKEGERERKRGGREGGREWKRGKKGKTKISK